jgi:hypothetical protein
MSIAAISMAPDELRSGDEAWQREERADRRGSLHRISMSRELHHFQARSSLTKPASAGRFLHHAAFRPPT